MEKSEKKSFSFIVKDFIKECGDYTSGLKVIWTVLGLISFFIVFYYEDVYLGSFNISLFEIDFNWKYYIYKAIGNFIIYSALFVFYIFSEYLIIWAKGFKQWMINIAWALVFLTAISFCDLFIIFKDSFLSNLLPTVILTAILFVMALITACISRGFTKKEYKINSNEQKIQNKEKKQKYVILVSCILAVVIILAFIASIAKNNAKTRKQFKVLLDEPNTIILYEDKNIFITCPYQQVTTTIATETKTLTEIRGDKTSIKEEVKTDVQELMSFNLYINEHNTIERKNHITRMITIDNVVLSREEYMQN